MRLVSWDTPAGLTSHYLIGTPSRALTQRDKPAASSRGFS